MSVKWLGKLAGDTAGLVNRCVQMIVTHSALHCLLSDQVPLESHFLMLLRGHLKIGVRGGCFFLAGVGQLAAPGGVFPVRMVLCQEAGFV